MSYNVIGLPEEIRFANNAKIFYVYTADGAKVQKQGAYLPGSTSGSTVQKKIDYTAAGVFTDNSLTFIPTAEGRALPPIAALSGTAFRYEYQLTDHLDNLRTACRCGEKLDSLGNVVALLPSNNLRNLVQENAYDPWGLNLPDVERSAVLPDWWQFSMKERDYRAYDEFEFRHYDAAIGRFMSIDPLAQMSAGQTPFSYASNNPSSFIDLYGLVSISQSISGWQKFSYFASGAAGTFVNIGIQAYNAQSQSQDWYRAKDGTLQYNPNVKSQSDLGAGQTYIGATFKSNSKSGSIEYRKDGSIMYSNQTEAYRRIWNNSTVGSIHEESAAILENSVLVFPSYSNNSTTANPGSYGYKFMNGNLIDAVGNTKRNLISIIHTHPDKDGSAGPSIYTMGSSDVSWQARNIPGKLGFILGHDNVLYGLTAEGVPDKPNSYTPYNFKRLNNISVNDVLQGTNLRYAAYPFYLKTKR